MRPRVTFVRTKITSSQVSVCVFSCLAILCCVLSSASSPREMKKALRLDIAKKIKDLSAAQKAAESNKVTEQVLNHPAYKNSKRVSVYVSRDDEIETRGIIKNIFVSGKECFIPRYEKKEMQMLKLDSLTDLDKLVKNKENIFQISKDKPVVDALETGGLELILLPGVAFTRDGKRCGRGGGYYDKYMTELKKISPNCGTMGLAFGCQIVDDLPMSDYDVPLNHVIHPLEN